MTENNKEKMLLPPSSVRDLAGWVLNCDECPSWGEANEAEASCAPAKASDPSAPGMPR